MKEPTPCFAGPMEMKLRITNETQQVEDVGVLGPPGCFLAMNFAPGVDVDKIRTGSRRWPFFLARKLLYAGP